LYTRTRVRVALRRNGSWLPFFFKGDPTPLLDTAAVDVGRNVFIGEGAWLSIAPGARLTIGDNTHINRYFVLACVGQVTIGRNVVMADRAFVGDTNHGYADPSTPIIFQPMAPSRPVVIEDDCWLGINVCVLSGVRIGRHSVIGANSVVTRDVPPYSVAAGNPARIVKQYDPLQQAWIRPVGER
jgi:acetyltransferase-like isoleucine patch superfamily enzyme